MLISVVYSFRNEEATLPELLQRTVNTLTQLPQWEYEIIFVNDASTDRSLELLREAHAANARIKIVNMTRNFGVSECVIAGLQFSSGDLVVYLDADLQDPPELIPSLVDAWKNHPGAEIVYTTRRVRNGEGWVKLAVTKLGYWILGKVSQVEIPPNSGDFKLLSRRAVDELLMLKEQKPFIRGLVGWIGFKQVQVFYDRDARGGGGTKFPVLGKKVITNFLDSALISFSDFPLKMLLLAGVTVLFGAFCFLIWIFVQKMIGWAIPGWSAIMATILFLGGFQILTLGIMGLYLHAIYLSTKGRPLFLVKNAIGFIQETKPKSPEPARYRPSPELPPSNA